MEGFLEAMFLLVKNYKNMSLCITSCAKVQTEMLSIHLLLKLIFLSLHFLSLLTVATQGICVLQHKTKNYTEPPLWVWLWQGNGSDGWDVAHKWGRLLNQLVPLNGLHWLSQPTCLPHDFYFEGSLIKDIFHGYKVSHHLVIFCFF